MIGRKHMSMSAFKVETDPSVEIHGIPCLSDNYAWLLKEKKTGMTAVVDTPQLNPIENTLKEKGWKLDYILNTHHHMDHTGANLDLKSKYQCKIIGPLSDKARIPGIDIALKDGETWKFGNIDVIGYNTPGHTKGHISYYLPEIKSCFTGDTLFLMGCGRLFEGTADQMYKSLSKLKSLPKDTLIFCGHEYTQANARFAVSIDKTNENLIKRKNKIDELRKKGMVTVPATLEEELETNPFLRSSDINIKKSLGLSDNVSDVDAFAAVRRAKDVF